MTQTEIEPARQHDQSRGDFSPDNVSCWRVPLVDIAFALAVMTLTPGGTCARMVLTDRYRGCRVDRSASSRPRGRSVRSTFAGRQLRAKHRVREPRLAQQLDLRRIELLATEIRRVVLMGIDEDRVVALASEHGRGRLARETAPPQWQYRC